MKRMTKEQYDRMKRRRVYRFNKAFDDLKDMIYPINQEEIEIFIRKTLRWKLNQGAKVKRR